MLTGGAGVEVVLDPAIAGLLRGVLIVVFAAAAWHKLRDPAAFLGVVAEHRLVPARAVPVVAAAVTGLEALVVPALVWPPSASLGAVGVLLLLGVYSAAIGINLARGRRDIDCGCLGPARRQPLSPALLVRNAALAALALGVLVPVSARAIGWIDAVTVVGGVAVASSLLAAATRLASAPPSILRPPRAARSGGAA